MKKKTRGLAVRDETTLSQWSVQEALGVPTRARAYAQSLKKLKNSLYSLEVRNGIK